MKYCTAILFCFVCICSYAQNMILEYQECIGCPSPAGTNPPITQGLYQYGQASAFSIGDLESDFSMRRAGVNSRWHRGIDLRNHGAGEENNQRGDAIINPDENATIVQFDHTNYKWIVLDGATYDFGYGHLFSHHNISSTTYRRSGNFVLKNSEMDSLGNQVPCIINLNTCIAYSEFPDRMVILPANPHCADTLTTTNEVAQGAAFAPIGGSGNAEFPVHIHLYKLRDPTAYWTNENSMDPMVDLDNSDTEYALNLSTNANIEAAAYDNWGQMEIEYPGINYNTISLRATLDNAMQGVDASRYTNVAMSLDSVGLRIKHALADSFVLIHGPFYRSEFLLHARRNTSLYPSVITTQYGDQTHTGMSPRAYQDGVGFRPYDNFYFADFVTRIHRQDSMGDGITQIAYTPHNARYPDGPYELYAQVTDVRDSNFYSDTMEFELDNFAPFIDSVIFLFDDQIGYNAAWRTTDDGLRVEYVQHGDNEAIVDFNTADLLPLTVFVSEPLDSLRLQIPEINYDRIVYMLSDSFTFHIQRDSILALDQNGDQTYEADLRFRFSGTDVSGNELLVFRNTTNEYTGSCGMRTNDQIFSFSCSSPHFGYCELLLLFLKNFHQKSLLS